MFRIARYFLVISVLLSLSLFTAAQVGTSMRTGNGPIQIGVSAKLSVAFEFKERR
jgi:hypothetical protein